MDADPTVISKPVDYIDTFKFDYKAYPGAVSQRVRESGQRPNRKSTSVTIISYLFLSVFPVASLQFTPFSSDAVYPFFLCTRELKLDL